MTVTEVLVSRDYSRLFSLSIGIDHVIKIIVWHLTLELAPPPPIWEMLDPTLVAIRKEMFILPHYGSILLKDWTFFNNYLL